MKLLLLFALLVSSINSSHSADGKISFIKGSVKINGKLVTKKVSISYGDKIRVGKKSLVIIRVNPSTILKLKQRSFLKIEKPRTNKSKTKTLYSYALKYGDMFVKAKKNKANSFRVIAKDTVMGVRGTNFFVSSSKAEKNIWMCVNEGKVAVSYKSKPSKKVLVNAGEGVHMNSDKLPTPKPVEWTRNLNWKTSGSFEEIEDKTDIRNKSYDLKNFDYE